MGSSFFSIFFTSFNGGGKDIGMITAICELALVILLFIGLYTIPVLPMILGAGFIIWCIKH